jgi:hypothetical protein
MGMECGWQRRGAVPTWRHCKQVQLNLIAVSANVIAGHRAATLTQYLGNRAAVHHQTPQRTDICLIG